LCFQASTNRKFAALQYFIAGGAAAGLVHSLAVYPLDALNTRLQNGNHIGNHSFRGLMLEIPNIPKPRMAIVGKATLVNALAMGLYEHVKSTCLLIQILMNA
jgi:hypothetical protein